MQVRSMATQFSSILSVMRINISDLESQSGTAGRSDSKDFELGNIHKEMNRDIEDLKASKTPNVVRL